MFKFLKLALPGPLVKYDYNVKIHDDWTKILRVVDIFPSVPDCGVRIMYELEAYESYIWGVSILGRELGFGD